MKDIRWAIGRSLKNAGLIVMPMFIVLLLLWASELAVHAFGGAGQPHLAANVVVKMFELFMLDPMKALCGFFVVATLPIPYQLNSSENA